MRAFGGGSEAGGRRGRGVRALVVLVVILAAVLAVLLAANAAFALLVERRAEESLEARLGSAADVDLSGFPVAPRVLTGSLPEADIAVENVRLPGTGLSFGRLDVSLADVRYEGEREGPLDPPIEAREARFRSRLTEGEVSGLAGSLPGVNGVRLSDGGLRLLLAGRAAIDAELAAEGGGLVLRPDTPILNPELPLTPKGLPGGVSVDEVRVGAEGVTIEGDAGGLGVRE